MKSKGAAGRDHDDLVPKETAAAAAAATAATTRIAPRMARRHPGRPSWMLRTARFGLLIYYYHHYIYHHLIYHHHPEKMTIIILPRKGSFPTTALARQAPAPARLPGWREKRERGERQGWQSRPGARGASRFLNFLGTTPYDRKRSVGWSAGSRPRSYLCPVGFDSGTQHWATVARADTAADTA